MSFLFDMDAVKKDSPKLAWMKEHGIITFRHPGWGDECPPSWFAGFQDWWPDLKDGASFFFKETAHNGDSRCVEADTQDEALCLLANRYKLKIY